MKRFYCTVKRGQVVVESGTTIIDTDDRVKNFFEPTPDGYRKAYNVDGLSFNELIPLPTQAELDQQAKDARIAEIDTRLTEIDVASVRPLRSKSNGRGIAQDDTTLTDLDDEAILLRTERATLV